MARLAFTVVWPHIFHLSKNATGIELHWAEGVLLLFGVVLVVGLVGEYAEGSWWKRREKIFELCVIIGVAGELLADGAIFRLSERLQELSDNDVAELTLKADQAEQAAAVANAEAKGYDNQIEAAKNDASQARLTASTNALRVAEAQQQTARLQKDAENERAARLKIEVSLQDRALTPQQRDTLVAVLKGGGALKITVRCTTQVEPQKYTQILIQAIRDAGWTVEEYKGLTMETRQGQGLTLMVHDTNKAPLAAVLLQRAFKDIGIDTNGVSNPDQIAEADTLLYVGVR
jgi:hypothetical protein